ncbi:MAG: tRNA (adenosine(37)-N6)-dimethylallyltransferase MiaA [Campylobacteraceae bacterium]|nr:tRNA (adenosine(37)-N6)-dimethylallyltransferase MiaA [Campylobacteraceae bacterium]
MKEIAIIGPTASGKTSLSIEMAHKTNSIILSVDSLSVYKKIDIASAKPTLKERDGIKHFGIDEVYPDQKFDVMEFITCYKRAKSYAEDNSKNLIIVGGTGFYVKTLLEGMSEGINEEVTLDYSQEETYELLSKLDFAYMQKIEKNDSYRIRKAYSIYKVSGLVPSEYFLKNKKTPISKDLKIFEIIWPRDELVQRIKLRTKIMLDDGVINEVIDLEKKYTREPNSMSAIGIIETLDYLDGKITKLELAEKIATNTARLAKRQATFNRGQFNDLQIKNSVDKLNQDILKFF